MSCPEEKQAMRCRPGAPAGHERRSSRRWQALSLAVIALAACGAPKAAPLTIVTDDLTDLPLRGSSPAQRDRFAEGDAQFDEVYRAPDGLGPVFIRAQCSGCHQGAARGPGFVTKMAQSQADGGQSELFYGHTERPRSVNGATPLLAPRSTQVVVSQRSSPAVFGRGYLEAIADSEIEALEAAQRAAGQVSGRINRVTYASQFNAETAFHRHQPGDSNVIGRFGLKARIATLDDFSADALQGDMGLTSPLRPTELANPDGVLDDDKLGVDVPLAVVNQLADYMRLLEIPARRVDDRYAEALFAQVGCANCHVPTLKTRADYPIAALAGIDAAIYSDVLVHDMGPSFSDGLIDGDAQPSEWKTAPLIGYYEKKGMLLKISEPSSDGVVNAIKQGIAARK